MQESEFQSKFNRWARARWSRTAAFELKITQDGSIPFADVKPHQAANLYFAKHESFIYKIPDDTIAQKPFDAFMLAGVPAYVVVMFYRRGVKHFYMIDIDIWKEEDRTSKRRSLTEERASEIGDFCTLD